MLCGTFLDSKSEVFLSGFGGAAARFRPKGEFLPRSRRRKRQSKLLADYGAG